MSADVTTELRIPELWYDFYARLLPGAAFLAAIRVLLIDNATVPSLTTILVLLGLGYLVGLSLYPITSAINQRLHAYAERSMKKDDGYVHTVSARLGAEGRLALALTKLNAEGAFFVQLAVLTLLFAVGQLRDLPLGWAGLGMSIAAAAYFAIGALSVAKNRVKRASNYEKYPSPVTPKAS